MIWLVTRLRRDFGVWERATQIAFVLGIVLLVAALGIALSAPPDARLPILAGAGGLLIVLEVTVLWGNRGMVSAFTRAQRFYMAGDLEAARDLLETVHGKADARALTLLGNTYRQLGQLRESETVLSEAVDKAPDHYFPLYGFGRTLLAEGRYSEAADAIRRALELGAPLVVQADLGEVYYRLNEPEAALTALRAANTGDITDINETQRALMVGFLLYRLGQAAPPAPQLVRDGLPYWQATAERFRETPYGAALTMDVREMLNQGAGSKRMYDRRGRISPFRVAVIVAVIGIVLIGLAVFAYLQDQAAHRSPLVITPYPNAVYWGTSNVKTTSQNVFYRVADTPEKVATYYEQKMVEHYGNSEQTCVRLPATGVAPGSDTNPNIPPYVYRCMFDNSGFNTSQYTSVEIYPGEANPDPFYNAKGLTIVKYDEEWQR